MLQYCSKFRQRFGITDRCGRRPVPIFGEIIARPMPGQSVSAKAKHSPQTTFDIGIN